MSNTTTWILGALFGGAATVSVIGLIANAVESNVALQCDKASKVILDGTVYECRRMEDKR